MSFQKTIRNTILSSQKYKLLDIISATELNHNVNQLEKLLE